jgi:sugar phosphate isomerase/epimerase
MELKLACADFTFPLLPHNSVLSLIAMLEFDGVDVGLFQDRSHIQPSTAFADLKKNAKELNSNLKSRGIELADIFLQIDLVFDKVAVNHPDKMVRKETRDLFVKAVEFTYKSGGKHLSILPGVYFSNETREDSFKRCCEELSWRCEKACEAGIVFAVEPHIGYIVPTPEEALLLVESVPGLTLTLDYTHFIRVGITEKRIEPLIKYASHFHARGAAKDRLQTSFKENTINYEYIVNKMKQTNYSGYIGIEYVWQEWENCNKVDNLSETILFRDFMRKLKGL